MPRVPIDLILCRHWNDSDGGQLGGAEVISESIDCEEYVEAGRRGELVHRVSPARSYLKRACPVVGDPYTARVVEKALELTALWNRRIDRIISLDASGGVIRRLWPRVPFLRSLAARLPQRRLEAPPPIRTVDLICCSYNRLSETELSLRSMLAEANQATSSGLPTSITVVHQNDWFPRRLLERRPEWAAHPALRLVASAPGLPRARNVGLAHSHADLVIFVDDDVQLEPGFVMAHVAAANAHPDAVGVAGRIRSKTRGAHAPNEAPSVGQVRASGWVDGNFDSIGRPGLVVVPHTPRGANMAFRRAAMTGVFGTSWFDDTLGGSAHREETTLGMGIFRRGLHLVYEPGACLIHLESECGGCENRGPKTHARRVAHSALDQLFLNRFYAPARPLRNWAPLLTVARSVRHAQGAREKIAAGWANVLGFQRGRRMFLERSAADQRAIGMSANTMRA